MFKAHISQWLILLAVSCVIILLAVKVFTGGQEKDSSDADQKDVQFTASNGLSSAYHVYSAHIERDKPVGALFWFHGDGAYEYQHPEDQAYIGGTEGILKTAKEHNFILIVPKTPDDVTETWWQDWEGNTDYVLELYEEILDKYKIDTNHVWQAGFSGGAEFTSNFFLPWLLEDTGVTGGGAIMFGGGSAPMETARDLTQPKDIESYPLRWIVGENDNAELSEEHFDGRGEAEKAEDLYHKAGWDASIEIVEGEAHLLDGMYGEYIDRIITESEEE
jgi:poly(3-hydroxybutyrate) depolymerase